MKVVQQKTEDRGWTFPCLMIEPDTKAVILATGRGNLGITGMIIIPGRSGYPVGEYATDWGEDFVPTPDTFEVSND